MEPISMIVGALVAGATAAAKKVGGRAVEQAYDALTGLIADRYKRKGAVAALEEDPSSETQKKALEEALAKTEAPTDAELIQKAKELTQALEQVPRAELTAVGVRIGELEAINARFGEIEASGGIGVYIDKLFDMLGVWTQPVADRMQFDQLRRREFITLLGSAAAWPLPARAQQEVYRIGVLVISGPELMGQYREALHDLGYIDGKNIEYVLRSAAGQIDRLPALAAELVDSKVNIIVASLTPAVLAAKNATRDIPIVMAPAGDPVGMKIVESYARPGGNITGMSGIAVELGAKNLDLIREISPVARRLAVLHNAADPLAKSRLEQIQHAGKLTSFDVWPVVVHSNNEVPNAFAAMARERPDVVLIPGSLPVQPMLDLALKERLPAIATHKSIVHAGALAAYSVSFADLGREIAHYVDRILKGAKPADLPVQEPTKYELVINLKTARALGLDLPATLLARADEVIE